MATGGDVHMMAEDSEEDLLGPASPRRAAWCQFDSDWYLTAYPQARTEITDTSSGAVRQHYLTRGRARRWSPNMYFDEAYYLRRYKDVAALVAAGAFGSGYEHYCTVGHPQRGPHWLFDDELYARHSPDLDDTVMVDHGCFNRYDHYLKSGAREDRVAHLLFDPRAYRAAIGGTPIGDNPFADFLRRMWRDKRDLDVTAFFEPVWYASRYPETAEAGFTCALHHYLGATDVVARDPLPEFSESFYLAHYPDVAAAVEVGQVASGYDQFLRAGALERRAPSPEHELPAIDPAHGEAAGRDAFLAALRARRAAEAAAPPVVAPPIDPPAGERARGHGQVEVFGGHAGALGWFFGGVVRPAPDGNARATARFELGDVTGNATVATYPRDDHGEGAAGLLLHVPGLVRDLGRLIALELDTGGRGWTLTPTEGAGEARDAELTRQLQPALAEVQGRLADLAGRGGFTGGNTLPDLQDRVFLEVEDTIVCPPGGLVLIGWTLSAPGTIATIRLHCGDAVTELRPETWVRFERQDVIRERGDEFGLRELRNGFIAYASGAYADGFSQADGPAYLSVETARGEIGYRGIPAPSRTGLPAMRYLLDRFELRYDMVAPAFDHVIGPAIASLNHQRLQARAPQEVIRFGKPVADPVLSVIVPLYGRLDFIEYQQAFLSRHRNGLRHEFIYVLDAPNELRAAEQLCASVFARFGAPFRLAVMSQNLGYAPANNAGIALANGDYVCLLNSDVFPGTPDWMERLVSGLRGNRDLGAIGPLLLFEDATVQHLGMVFEPQQAFGDWLFPIHERKGWRRPEQTGLRRCDAITGACLVMERALLRELGGLDERFAIGDFEDSDLCMKIAERGLACAVDLDTALYHLERQSQERSDQRWRMNLTLFNAWVHERRWGPTLRARASSHPIEFAGAAE